MALSTQDLRAERSRALDEYQAIVDGAKSAQRALTNDESKRLDDLKRRAKDIYDDLNRSGQHIDSALNRATQDAAVAGDA